MQRTSVVGVSVVCLNMSEACEAALGFSALRFSVCGGISASF
jgi:hypothetical protein